MSDRIADDIQKAHDRIAESYGLVSVKGEINPASYDAWNLMENVIKPLRTITEKHWMGTGILDAGCGNGQIAQILLDAGVERITGVDFSEKMLRQASERMNRSGYKKRFSAVRANLDKLEMLKTESFDGAILFGVLEHLDTPEKVIENICDRLKPDAVFALAVPRKGSLSYFSYMMFGESPNCWGTGSHWRNRFRFQEKAKFYRFYTPLQIETILAEIPRVELIDRIPFAYAHLDGLPGFLLRLTGRSRKKGHRVLTWINTFCRRIRLIPAGEYWLIRKQS